MKKYILLLPALLSVNVVLADSEPYAWVLEQYQRKLADNPDANDPIANVATAVIDGDEYLVISAHYSKPADLSPPAILLFRKTSTGYQTSASMQVGSLVNYSYEIKNDSFYLTSSNAHNGLYDNHYQFKRIQNKFRLIGIESQRHTASCYSDGLSDDCSDYDVWSKESLNLLTSTAICWRENVPTEPIDKKWTQELDRYKKWLQPKGGARHTVKFKPIPLPLLDGFDASQFEPPKTCSFDKNYRLNK